MKLIQILGTGCSKCRTLADHAEQAVKQAGIEAQVVKVQEITEILLFDGVRALPALAIDGVVRFCGRVPTTDEIRASLV